MEASVSLWLNGRSKMEVSPLKAGFLPYAVGKQPSILMINRESKRTLRWWWWCWWWWMKAQRMWKRHNNHNLCWVSMQQNVKRTATNQILIPLRMMLTPQLPSSYRSPSYWQPTNRRKNWHRYLSTWLTWLKPFRSLRSIGHWQLLSISPCLLPILRVPPSYGLLLPSLCPVVFSRCFLVFLCSCCLAGSTSVLALW